MVTIIFKFPSVIPPYKQVISKPSLQYEIKTSAEIPSENEIIEFGPDTVLYVKEVSGNGALFGEIYPNRVMVVTSIKRRIYRNNAKGYAQQIIINLTTHL